MRVQHTEPFCCWTHATRISAVLAPQGQEWCGNRKKVILFSYVAIIEIAHELDKDMNKLESDGHADLGLIEKRSGWILEHIEVLQGK